MDKIYDVIIVGSGPAGITAGIYASRAGLSVLMLEGNFIQGGQIVNTYEIDNYPGFPKISGMELAEKMKEHLSQYQVEICRAKVKKITLKKNIKVVNTKKEIFYGKTVVLASGAVHRMLQVKGEEKFAGMGVSYCATCDGAFFKGKTVAVVGGGDVALEDALFLARTCEKVYLIHRREAFRGTKCLQNAVKNTQNIEICWNQTVEEIGGEEQVQWIHMKNVQTEEQKMVQVAGVFVAVGIEPDTEFVKNLIEMDEAGYIKADEDGKTNIAGIFVAGDCRKKTLRQIVTAVADGANCITSAEEYLLDWEEKM